ncbi:MAG: hypothetical protein ACO391_12305, partial [Pseudomonadales bacterium]
MTEGKAWVDPSPGFQLKTQRVIVASDDQRSKLDALAIDASRFNGWVDPAFFIGLGIHAGIESG